jgi:raffinose/stachyose/melibiose transport system substrate-binding protein
MKRYINSTISRCVAAAMGLALTASCGYVPPQDQPASPSPSTFILYLTVGNENFGSTRIINELAQEYMQSHPEVRFNVESVRNNDLSQKVQLLAASNDLPVMFSYQSGEPLLDMIEGGAVLNVQETFEQLGIADKLNPIAVQLLNETTNGAGLYALPLEMNIEGFWYNKTIFALYNIKEPQSWDDMLQAASVLKSAGVQPFTVAGKDKWPITRLINAYAIRKLGADAMERVYRHELDLTDPGFVEAAETVQQMAQKGYLGANPNMVDIGSSMNQFVQGKAAMIYNGSWTIRDMNIRKEGRIDPDEIGFFSIPLVKDGRGTLDEYPMNAGLTTSLAQNAYTPEVGDFMKYVFERYGDRAMSELGMITGFTTDKPTVEIPPLTRMILEKLDRVTQTSLWFEARFNTQTQLLAWNNAQLLIASGGMTPFNYMSQLHQALDR